MDPARCPPGARRRPGRGDLSEALDAPDRPVSRAAAEPGVSRGRPARRLSARRRARRAGLGTRHERGEYLRRRGHRAGSHPGRSCATRARRPRERVRGHERRPNLSRPPRTASIRRGSRGRGGGGRARGLRARRPLARARVRRGGARRAPAGARRGRLRAVGLAGRSLSALWDRRRRHRASGARADGLGIIRSTPMPTLTDSRKLELRRELETIVGRGAVLSDPDELMVYESDGLTLLRALADFVVFPTSAQHVSAVVKLANRENLPFVARGAGTGLSGGCLPAEGGIVISLMRMNKVLEVDYENQIAVVEPGLVNLHLSWKVGPRGYYYAPDPSSQQACTIGGNIANNSGGPHTLKYGVTTNHVLGLEVVMPDGEIVWLGGKTREACGYDLAGVFVGSEGTFGIATRIVVRILKKPQAVKTVLAVFDAIDQASAAVSAIIARGLVPAAMEMIDHLTIQAVEDAFNCGYPRDADAGLRVGNVFHAGDGNLHPNILYDPRKPGEEARVVAAGAEIMKVCAGVGGSISGEHGIGLEKADFMPFIFSVADLALMHRLKKAFNPSGQCNPAKIFPTKTSCVEVGPVAYRPHAIEEKGLAQRF